MTSYPALIPVNRIERAKGRLAGLLDSEERQTLAMITFEAVLRACEGEAVILTDDPRVTASARGRARVMAEDPGASGLNGQLEAAVARLVSDGTAKRGLLILHADLPLASNEAIETLFEASEPRSVVMVESRDGGTNAMLMREPGTFALAYGTGSFAAHSRAAKAAGFHIIRNENRELRLDLDTPDDIRELLRAPRGRQGAAGVFLQAIAVDERLERLR